MLNKRGQGLSFKVIVVAAISLIVLVSVIAIFVSKSSTISKKFDECESKGGFCARGCSEGFVSSPFECKEKCQSGMCVCCFKFYEESKSEIVEGELFQ